ncbi:MAG: VIT domain-containing protein [Candidatus Obscuribacterales bacterium]
MDGKRTKDELIALLNDLFYDRKREVGTLSVKQRETTTNLPLAGMDIDARVTGRVADVKIVQQFKNEFPEHLEATYIFPLSGSASVNSFTMKVDGRVVEGVIAERQQARQQYQQAIEDGKRAAIMEQERDDIFTVNVGNIPPGQSITIILEYTEKLQHFDDGCTEIRLPLVIAPRYIPGEELDRDCVGKGFAADTDRVPDASRISPPRLAEGFKPDIPLGITVDIAGQEAIADLACTQHAVKTSLENSGSVRVSLARRHELADRDFVLRWRQPVEDVTAMAVSTPYPGKQSGHLAMLSLVAPPASAGTRVKRDIVFLVDRSGSMAGEKIVSARRACQFLLSSLGPDDRFAIDAFDHESIWLHDDDMLEGRLLPATEENIEAGLRFIDRNDARGGTEILGALKESVSLFAEEGETKNLPVIVLITDGQIADEHSALKYANSKIRGVRVFSVGVDTAVNFGFLSQLARIARGTSTFVTPGEELEEALRQIARDIGAPAVTEVKIEASHGSIVRGTMSPSRPLDLFEGRTSDLFFEYREESGKTAEFVVTGKYADGSEYRQTVVAGKGGPGVGRLWARRYIGDLEDRYRSGRGNLDKIKGTIIEISLKFSVLSRFTAFTCVDDEKVNLNGDLREVVQPVPMPQGWSSTGFSSMAFGGPGVRFSRSSSGDTISGSMNQSMSYGWGAPPSGGAWDCPPPPASAGNSWGAGFSAPQSQNPGSNWAMPKRSRSASQPGGTLRRLGGNSGPLARVSKAVDEYERVWRESWELIENGSLPDVVALEEIARELSDALDDHPVGFKMHAIMRHSNSSLKSFVSALRAPNLTIPAIKALRAQLNAGFEQAVADARAAITSALGKGSAFWESTV